MPLNRHGLSAVVHGGFGRGRGFLVRGRQSSAFFKGRTEPVCSAYVVKLIVHVYGTFQPHRSLEDQRSLKVIYLGYDFCSLPWSLLGLMVGLGAAFRVTSDTVGLFGVCEGRLSVR